ncbi:hypothetical protein J3458_005899 [Metarhizium acridum]|uniref:uncharacterized protein n=1 Tax=Metarhizium acridum TaxID=92637 RepID=UPI001C6AD4A4|nr:hypothetical protein J3458_005899 [Metarhizium acridum]
MWPRVFGSSVNSTTARSKSSRGNSMLVRRRQVRIASLDIQLENASSAKIKEEQWEPSLTVPEEQRDENFNHAK